MYFKDKFYNEINENWYWMNFDEIIVFYFIILILNKNNKVLEKCYFKELNNDR